MTQTEIAKQVNISLQHLNDILCGRKRPSIKLALKLAEITGYPLEFWACPSKYPELLESLRRKKRGRK